jgi:hypothetical protein
MAIDWTLLHSRPDEDRPISIRNTDMPWKNSGPVVEMLPTLPGSIPLRTISSLLVDP